MFDLLLQGFAAALQPGALLAMALGVAWGILGGALPGITGSMAMALLLPLTFGMDTTVALMVLAGVWAGAGYGGSIPAILIKTPGTPSAAATIFDGWELNKQGKAGKALGISLVVGTFGGLVSVIVLILLVIPLGEVVIAFSPAEYFAVALFGLTIISSLGGPSVLKGLISGLGGLLIATVGLDPLSGVPRFTFGNTSLYDGFEIVAVMVGLFAVSEMFRQAAYLVKRPKITATAYTEFPSVSEFRSVGKATFIGTIVGLIAGVMPGAGMTVASFVAYNEAKRFSSHPEMFGKGSLEGVAAPETANNSVQGGDLVPALALGIPGSNSAAIMLAALILHGVMPGPLLLTQHADIVYGLFAALIIVNFLMLVIGFFMLRGAMAVVNVPPQYLIMGVMLLVTVGTYSINNSMFDVWTALAFGLLGYFMNKYGFSAPSMVLGMILGFLMETSFRRALIISDGSFMTFLERPISLAFIVLALLTLFYPVLMKAVDALRGRGAGPLAAGAAVENASSDLP